MPRPQPPPGFMSIGPGIYINLIPITFGAVVQAHGSAPDVILIFGWMGALTRHLQHYSQKYSELYPHATQIIIKCSASFFCRPQRATQKRLMPVVEALEALGCLPATNQQRGHVRSRVLIHSFSNGGGVQMTSLGRLLATKYPSIPPSERLVSALILDSAPSTSDFRSIGLAFRIAIRNLVARYVVLAAIYTIHIVRLSLQAVFGVETLPVQYIKALLQPRLFPWMDSRTPRLYVFSKKDELVPWQSVQRHADAAKAAGLNVRCEVYEESAHVAHMRLDPDRYWASIQDLWQTACRDSEENTIETA